MAVINELINWINNPVKHIKFDEFKKAISSIDEHKIAELLYWWGKKYFDDLSNEYVMEIQMFLSRIVVALGKLKKEE